VLSHLEARDQFGAFLGDVKGKLGQRGGAFAEARVALWFSRNGFRITRWHPKVTKYAGDHEVQWETGRPFPSRSNSTPGRRISRTKNASRGPGGRLAAAAIAVTLGLGYYGSG